jgi:hypothetical protein
VKYNPLPLHPSQICPAEPLYRVDCLDRTQRTLERRAEQTHPTAATTRGVPAWRWGRAVDRPRPGSTTPQIFGPSDLEKAPAEQPAPASIRDVIARLKP